MFFVGARDIAAPPAHLGQPVSSLLNEAHMEAVVAGDAKREKELEAGMKHLQAQIDLARGHLYSSPFFLLGFGVLHFAFGAAAIIVMKSRSLSVLLRRSAQRDAG